MSRSKFALNYLALLLGLAIAISPLLAMAQQYTPPQRGVPGRREGGGTRGSCMEAKKLLLMPLIPNDAFSATVSERPTLFWYVPTTTAQTAEFRLLDQAEQELYQTTVALPGTAGIVSLTLPEQVARTVLKPGQDYYWQFSIICDPAQPSKNPFVEGVIQQTRLTPAVTRQLEQAKTPRDRAAVYARNGIWQEAITTLATERCLRPQNTSAPVGWRTLLQSVQLGDYAQAPLKTFCQAGGAGLGPQ